MEIYVVIDEYRDLEDHHDFKGVFGDELEAYKFALEIKIDGHNIKVLPTEINTKLIDKDCSKCTNSKGCITCTNKDQYTE